MRYKAITLLEASIQLMRVKILFLTLFLIFVAAACQPAEEEDAIYVELQADGRLRTFAIDSPMTVSEFLAQSEVDVELGPLDRIQPPRFTQIYDGLRITVRRVEEQQNCEQRDIPFERQVVLNEGLAPGEERLVQAGQNGIEEVCFRYYIVDGVAEEPTQIGQPTVIIEPIDEIVSIGPSGELEPVRINGTLAYISNGNAWIIRNSSTAKRPLTTSGDLDNLVFSLSDDGRQLLFTRKTTDNDEITALNQLWYLPDTSVDREPIQLTIADVLWAAWVPGKANTFSYSKGEARQAPTLWNASNDLWIARIAPDTGEILDLEEVLEPSTGGLYGWWGTFFKWSPDGEKLAFSRADRVGLVDLERGELITLAQYREFSTTQPWSWRPNISWSPDGELIATTVHGPPVGNEEPDRSPAFNVAITDVEGSFQADVVDSAGMWSTPQFSNLVNLPDSPFPQGYIAYLQAREPYSSISGEYDLIVADRDGSNPRRIFPPDANQPGLTTQGGSGLAPQNFTWSPDGTQIALIYLGNLWVVDATSGVAHQLTLD
ncbi:MAG: hypothetical protein D6712_20980, partial [Chloroflexi bacterium]